MSSRTPTDEMTPDMGSSMLLPSFDFDEEMNEGVLEGARLPEVAGLSGLPDGVVKNDESREAFMTDEEFRAAVEDEDGMDLGMLMYGTEDNVSPVSGLPQPEDSELLAHTDEVPDVTDFSWLEDVEQDPERLPSLSNNTVIPELVEAWGTRTDGFTRVEMREPGEANYIASLEDDSPQYQFSDDDLRTAVARAMRRSAYGDDMQTIKEEIVRNFGHEAARISTPIKAVEDEHGLVGNVYVRASAFPGLSNGKRAKHIKRKCASAKYLIACGNCDACKGGCPGGCVCNRYLGLEAVAKVPWNRAYAHYAPRLEATGRLDRLATVMDKRLALKHAFTSHSEDLSPKIKSQRPVHKSPSEMISSERARTELGGAQGQREVIDPKQARRLADLKKVQAKIGQWAKARLLTKADVTRLLKSKARPSEILKAATQLVTATHKTASYEGQGEGMLEWAQSDRESAWKDLKRAEQEKKASQPKWHNVEGERHAEVEKMLRWARRQMSEGAMGEQLTQLLAARFSGKMLRAAKTNLVQLRSKHEGLAGTVYVDAGAYASRSGTTGCEKGAQSHRANGIPTVLEMARCGSCVFRNIDGVCQKYNKPLVPAASIKNASAYQAEQIRLADAPDHEVTAAMFSNPAKEFGLHNDLLDDVHPSDAPELSKLSEYTFGGMEIE